MCRKTPTRRVQKFLNQDTSIHKYVYERPLSEGNKTQKNIPL